MLINDNERKVMVEDAAGYSGKSTPTRLHEQKRWVARITEDMERGIQSGGRDKK